MLKRKLPSLVTHGKDRVVIPKRIPALNCQYRVCEMLGSGGYAVVVKAESILNNTEPSVAVKAIIKSRFMDNKLENLINNSKREIGIMKKLNHEFILKLLDHFEDEDYIYLVLELCNNKVSLLDAKRWLIEICRHFRI